jgi:hypothetical protein
MPESVVNPSGLGGVPTDTSGVQRAAPTAAAGANNGTTPPAPVVAGDSSDLRGSVTFGSGSTPAAGAQVVVTFTTPRDSNRLPVIQMTETTTALAALNPAVTAVTAAGFTVSTGSAPAASQGATVYGLAWALFD